MYKVCFEVHPEVHPELLFNPHSQPTRKRLTNGRLPILKMFSLPWLVEARLKVVWPIGNHGLEAGTSVAAKVPLLVIVCTVVLNKTICAPWV